MGKKKVIIMKMITSFGKGSYKMKKIILRNDPGKKRKKLGKVKDLFEQMQLDYNEFEHYINHINNKKGK